MDAEFASKSGYATNAHDRRAKALAKQVGERCRVAADEAGLVGGNPPGLPRIMGGDMGRRCLVGVGDVGIIALRDVRGFLE